MSNHRRRKPRTRKKRIKGTYPIDTGTASIVADPERDGAYVLEVNRVPSSYVVPGAPEVLGYDYMRWIADFIEAASVPEPFIAVHLGAAGCALPSYVQHRWDSRNIAVELDRGLAHLVRDAFDPPVEIAVAEARAFTHALAPGSVDVIVRDVFAGADTPRPLTTVEFYRAAYRALTPGRAIRGQRRRCGWPAPRPRHCRRAARGFRQYRRDVYGPRLRQRRRSRVRCAAP
ncbi:MULTISPECIES: spermidine synthase [Corynebacterium]|uniref:Spermidine synthase n=1 Tax=Corynebacterium ihumii TaxID=1232427 RepID=A0ABY7UD88_9CORY|nr:MULTISPECIES: hypothetical protein [Corynebacterium]WCZ34278.1 spermidine synthase [Corynebacterium ihumii]